MFGSEYNEGDPGLTNNGYNKQALELAQQWIDYYDTFNDIANALNIFKSIQ